jgi:hypothetical protein
MYRLAMGNGHATEDFSAIYEFVTDNYQSLQASTPTFFLLQAGNSTFSTTDRSRRVLPESRSK